MLAYRLQLVVVGRLVNKLSEKLCLVLHVAGHMAAICCIGYGKWEKK